MKFSRIALIGAATLAVAQNHGHVHRHPARHGSPVEARDPALAVVLVYELDGKVVSSEDVEAGLKSGKYVLLGDKISTIIPASPSAPTPTPTPSSSSEAAKFYEKASSSTTPTPAYVAPTTPTPSPPSSAAPVSISSYGSGSSGSGNIDSDFPSGTIKCDHFPSDYGAVYLEWHGLGGYTGVQKVPDYSHGIDSVISFIETAISGGGCTEKSFCSYACPAGYQKSQWPTAQGKTGQSIGGLFCNSDGYLELSRPEEKKICIPGVGGVKIKNLMGQNAAICRTDYPGSESETIPMNTQPGGEYDLCNPDQNSYYKWEGAATSAQYYINNAGVSVSDACTWGFAGLNRGNWAPVNMGAGRGSNGVTYISLFPNAPTNPYGTLNFNITIKGDVSGVCSYKGGNYYSGSSISPTGCTVGVPKGGEAYIEFSS